MGCNGYRASLCALLASSSRRPQSTNSSIRALHDHLRCLRLAHPNNRLHVWEQLAQGKLLDAQVQHHGTHTAYGLLRSGVCHLHDLHYVNGQTLGINIP